MAKYQAYSEYASTNTDWLGEAPKHWHTIPVGKLFTRIKRTDHTDKELLSVYRDYGVIPKSSRDDNNNKPSEDLSPYQLVEANDLVMNKMKTWQGSIAISEYEGIVSPAYFVYQPLAKLFDVAHPKYVHYLLRNPMYIAQYLRRSKGIRVNQWDLDPDEFQRVELLLPTKDEQLKIFRFLDHETAKIDTLIEKQQQLIKLLKEKRQAVISHAVTKGLNPNAPMRDSGVEWLGEVPAHWESQRLKFVCKLITGKISIDNHIVVALENIESWTGKYMATDSEFTGEDVGFNTGDVLFGKLRPYLAKVFHTENSGVAFGDLLVYRPSNRILSKYCFFQMISQAFIATVNSSTYGSKMPRASVEFVNDMYILVPSLDEQKEIVNFIVSRLEKLSELEIKAQSAIKLMQERRTALISAAVTGKIDVRNWKAPEQSATNKEVAA
ncbi:type I restriction enzyme, S subunit [Nitrosomonas aestuarii]|uniref:Type I restriction enzyme, S subunit n=1 Tax=Nitrosomonas aestuarii TaxID=52441 RepID=A0A1I4G0Q4_9PROT|nr:restriction endonuclease subunit S [Nitrosomonas aestuarii]SFL23299.1 type I restriction enzyme, S subunit [Nitrosomonas aestuarii]